MPTKTELLEISQTKLVIVHITGEDCVPCGLLKRQIDKRPPRQDGVFFLRVEATGSGLDLCREFNTFTVPSLLILYKGVEVQRKVGNHGPNTWNHFYDDALTLLYDD